MRARGEGGRPQAKARALSRTQPWPRQPQTSSPVTMRGTWLSMPRPGVLSDSGQSQQLWPESFSQLPALYTVTQRLSRVLIPAHA